MDGAVEGLGSAVMVAGLVVVGEAVVVGCGIYIGAVVLLLLLGEQIVVGEFFRGGGAGFDGVEEFDYGGGKVGRCCVEERDGGEAMGEGEVLGGGDQIGGSGGHFVSLLDDLLGVRVLCRGGDVAGGETDVADRDYHVFDMAEDKLWVFGVCAP